MTVKRPPIAGRTATGLYSKAFSEGIASLMEEIKLASRWSRPSILVAVHKGSTGQAKARARLKTEIEAIGKRIRNIDAGRENLNIVQTLLKFAEPENTVFFFSGIGKISETESRSIYRALNFHREILVENRIILVLWLGPAEAAELPRLAPDFWAFRHRVVEFAPDRGRARKA